MFGNRVCRVATLLSVSSSLSASFFEEKIMWSVKSLVRVLTLGALALFSLGQGSRAAPDSCAWGTTLLNPCFECRFQGMVTGVVVFVTGFDEFGNPILETTEIQLPVYGKCTQGPLKTVCYSVQAAPNPSNQTPTCSVLADQNCGGDFTRWLSTTSTGAEYIPVGTARLTCHRTSSVATESSEPAVNCYPIPGVIPPGGFWMLP